MSSDEHPPGDSHPDTPDDAARAGDGQGDDTLPQMLAAISGQIGEIRDQIERLLNVQLDRLRLQARKGLFWLLSSLLFGAVCVVATAVATFYLLEGVAGAFTALFGGNVWAGDLAAGGAVLLTILLAVTTFARHFRRKELGRLRRKYEAGSVKGDVP